MSRQTLHAWLARNEAEGLEGLADAVPEVLATAKAQRWDPAEFLRVLMVEEIRCRDNATRRARR